MLPGSLFNGISQLLFVELTNAGEIEPVINFNGLYSFP